VHEVCSRDILGDLQVDAERGQRGVCVGEFGRHQVREDVVLVARHPETTHDHIELVSKGSDELGYVYAGTAVHLRRILAADQVYSHI
jgi:hypothetical protein